MAQPGERIGHTLTHTTDKDKKMNTITDIATTAADRFDMDHHAALHAAREYLHQIEKIDGRDIDEDVIPQDDADFILESILRSQPEVTAHPLDEVSTTRDKLHQAREEHHDAIRAARAAGATIKDLLESSSYSGRQTIYDIIDGKK